MNLTIFVHLEKRMKVSYKWLQDYLPIEVNFSDLPEILTNTGLEVAAVEKVELIPGGLQGLVVGEILEVIKHPNADRLTITKVSTDKGEEKSIVCGAPNVKVGQKVVVALPGTKLHPIDGDPFEIKKGKIRGEISEGMICAEDEIGMGHNHDGIIVLEKKARIGMSVREYYKVEDDYSVEIDLTPNRTDAISHFGVARDYLAVKNLNESERNRLVIPDLKEFSIDNNDLSIEIEVEDNEACPRYSGLTMSGLTIEPSPDWLQQRLLTVGLNPINNIVDLANYVMYETGQPLHVFDADKIKGNKVVVKKLDSGTPFKTLDEQDRKLDRNDLMICNSEDAMCIAGVFGGFTSGVSDSTTNIFIESAYFSPSGIRKTARKHSLSTDASYRYERGANPEATVYALKRLAMMIKELTGAKISSDVVDVYPEKIKRKEVTLRLDYLKKIVGKELQSEKAVNILTSLGFEIMGQKEQSIDLSIPPYRAEVTREIDVVEEVLRIYGYNNIEIPKQMKSAITLRPGIDGASLRNRIGSLLSARGFREVMNNSLSSEKYFTEKNNLVKIKNPLSNELSVLRMSLNAGGLESIRFNLNRNSTDLKLFEFGKTYELDENGDFLESMKVALWISGRSRAESWRNVDKKTDYYDLKETLELVLNKLGVNTINLRKSPHEENGAEFGLDYLVGKKSLASIWKFDDQTLNNSEIEQEVYGAEIDWSQLLIILSEKEVRFEALPKFPSMRRDLALLVDESVQYSEIEKIARDIERKILREVNLFDVYKGKGIDPGKKSYAVSFVFRDDKKTLTDVTVDKVMSKLIARLKKDLSAELR